MCAAGCDEFCPETGFQVSGKAGIWPLGAAALVNQQTTHRGAAHTDPSAPPRVLFILTFAPRPQTGPKTVETRMIGFAGSYSLHWSQWGHTLADFQRPLARMQQPWRALRSLGVYKPRKSQWGWDYVTVSSCRISNEDTGFGSADLDDFVKKGGFWWLPKKLQANMPGGFWWLPMKPQANMTDDEEASFSWIDFLQNTVAKCREASTIAHRAAVATYVVVFAFGTQWRRARWSSNLGFSAIRLFVFHAVLLLVAWRISCRVVDSQWGHNIRTQKSFTLSKNMALAPKLPATLPTEHDILIFEGMKSDYFSSYVRVLEVVHPGNKAWNDLVATFAAGYDDLSPELQKHIRLSMLRFARQEHRRILVQNFYANWAEVPNELAHWFCHKSLRQRSNPYVHSAIQTLDFILSEIRFGYWRETSLNRRFAAESVIALRSKILGPQLHATMRSLGNISIAAISARRLSARAVPSLPVLPKDTRVTLKLRRRSGIPPEKPIPEPFTEAWMQEDDVVEATFVGAPNGKTHRCYGLLSCALLRWQRLTLASSFLIDRRMVPRLYHICQR